MIVYNTTYHVEEADEQLFLNWIHEYLIPEVLKEGTLKNPRLLRVLGYHQDEDEEGHGASYALQLEAEDTAALHHWYRSQGVKLNKELLLVFRQRVLGFSTMMEVVES